MFLLKAPSAKHYGSLEPRFYIDIDKMNNFSSLNQSGGNNKLHTIFEKVRLTSIRNKRGLLDDKFDCLDFTFASSNNKV